jgi:hypothetical protein
MTKTEVVDLEKLYNFVVDNFSFEIIYLKKLSLNFSHLKFKFFERSQMEKRPK